nr:LytTR family DNA-binding domain-containing protein [uncultured Carboxylicivirga sp.]
MEQPTIIKAVIVDDEENGRVNLREILKRYCPSIHIVGEAYSVQSAAELISEKQPNLVFLDIEMPGGNGFELLKALGHQEFEVIFVTAYDHYGIQAIKFSALDYILKPINYLELIEAVNKVEQRLIEKNGNKRLVNLIDNIGSSPRGKRLALPTQNSVEFVEVETIIRCQSDNNYTEFYLNDKRKLMVCKTLKDYEEILQEYGFFRPHQSHLINTRFLESYVKSNGGVLVMKDGVQIPVSRFKKNELKAILYG